MTGRSLSRLYKFISVVGLICVCLYVAVNSMVCHVISHVLATVTDGPGAVDRFMFRVYGLSEYLLKYVTVHCFGTSSHHPH